VASDGSVRPLTFEEARARVFDFSFDPHHCPERRWGARDPKELASCADDAAKTAWYHAQARLRNQIDRTYDVRMGFTLAELQARAQGSGWDTPPDIDVAGVFAGKGSDYASTGE
jgi:hypothetical protein